MSDIDMVPRNNSIPAEIVELPSRGLFYPEGHPLHKEETVEIKAMTAKEEDILTSKSLILKGAGVVIDYLIKSCLINKSIDVDSLLLGDKTAILLGIRRSGFGDEYRAQISCDSCSADFVHSFDLSKVKNKQISDESQNGLFSFVLPKSKQHIIFRLMTSGDDKEIQAAISAKKKLTENKKSDKIEIETNIVDKHFYSIVQLGSETDRSKIRSMVSNMLAADSRALRKKISEVEPDVDFHQEVTCPECGETSMSVIPLGPQFLWPELE